MTNRSFSTRFCGIIASALLISAPAATLRAQDVPRPFCRSAIYLEGLGPGLLYSINYDHRITEHVSLRAGFSTWSIYFPLVENSDFSFTGFPLIVSYLTGDGSSHFELGIGLVPATISVGDQSGFFGTGEKASATIVLGTATIGYRIQPPDGGFLLRLCLTPLMNSDRAIMYGGVSVGVGF
jgi:hypothetical protein